MIIADITKNVRSWTFLRRIRFVLRLCFLGQSGNKNNPNATLEFLEHGSRYATLLILAGIVIDVVVAIRFSCESWELIGAVAANGLIGIGLIGEYIIIGATIVASGEAGRQSKESVAAAIERAAKADLVRVELEAKLLPRMLNQDQWDFIQGLRGKFSVVPSHLKLMPKRDGLLARLEMRFFCRNRRFRVSARCGSP